MFFQNKLPKNTLYLVVTCNLTHLQDADTEVNFMLTILKSFMQDPKPPGLSYPDPAQDPEKIIPDPQHLTVQYVASCNAPLILL